MLRSRTFIPVLRQSPHGHGLLALARSSGVISRIPLLQSCRLQQRAISSTNSIIRAYTPSAIRWRPSLVSRIRTARHNSTRSSPASGQEHGSQSSQSLSGRFRELSRKYGWSAVGVYFGLSVLDFPFCFLAVRFIGTESIGEAEHALVNAFWSLVGLVLPDMRPNQKVVLDDSDLQESTEAQVVEVHAHHEKEDASIWTQLLLAYGVHKGLIFFRIPLTAAVTPKIVKTLRRWGWNVGRRGTFPPPKPR